MHKVFYVDIVPKDCPYDEIEDRLTEGENLVTTYGGCMILKTIQKKDLPDSETFVGSGKLDEIIEEMKLSGADLLIIGNILKPKQIYTINEKLREIKTPDSSHPTAQARDRVDLILKIFEKHATSAEAKLQIELASIKHMGPRIFGMGMELSRQGGGIGTKGIGETNTERMKRHLKEKLFVIRKKLEEYKRTRLLHRQSRKRKNLTTIGIVGYTNAGKSSLMNFLTKKDTIIENKLFATLGTHVGKMKLQTAEHTRNEFLINDTIGFIRDLPPSLIEAFSSTLEDSIESDILLHVIDISDPKFLQKLQIVDDILAKINAIQPRIYVFNKIDLISPAMLEDIKTTIHQYNPVYISTKTGGGIDTLKHNIIDLYQKTFS